MMSFYDEVLEGLKKAVDYEEGKLQGVRTRRLTKYVEEVRDFSPSEIRLIRKNAAMTQDLFARCRGQ